MEQFLEGKKFFRKSSLKPWISELSIIPTSKSSKQCLSSNSVEYSYDIAWILESFEPFFQCILMDSRLRILFQQLLDGSELASNQGR